MRFLINLWLIICFALLVQQLMQIEDLRQAVVTQFHLTHNDPQSIPWLSICFKLSHYHTSGWLPPRLSAKSCNTSHPSYQQFRCWLFIYQQPLNRLMQQYRSGLYQLPIRALHLPFVGRIVLLRDDTTLQSSFYYYNSYCELFRLNEMVNRFSPIISNASASHWIGIEYEHRTSRVSRQLFHRLLPMYFLHRAHSWPTSSDRNTMQPFHVDRNETFLYEQVVVNRLARPYTSACNHYRIKQWPITVRTRNSCFEYCVSRQCPLNMFTYTFESIEALPNPNRSMLFSTGCPDQLLQQCDQECQDSDCKQLFIKLSAHSYHFNINDSSAVKVDWLRPILHTIRFDTEPQVNDALILLYVFSSLGSTFGVHFAQLHSVCIRVFAIRAPFLVAKTRTIILALCYLGCLIHLSLQVAKYQEYQTTTVTYIGPTQTIGSIALSVCFRMCSTDWTNCWIGPNHLRNIRQSHLNQYLNRIWLFQSMQTKVFLFRTPFDHDLIDKNELLIDYWLAGYWCVQININQPMNLNSVITPLHSSITDHLLMNVNFTIKPDRIALHPIDQQPTDIMKHLQLFQSQTHFRITFLKTKIERLSWPYDRTCIDYTTIGRSVLIEQCRFHENIRQQYGLIGQNQTVQIPMQDLLLSRWLSKIDRSIRLSFTDRILSKRIENRCQHQYPYPECSTESMQIESQYKLMNSFHVRWSQISVYSTGSEQSIRYEPLLPPHELIVLLTSILVMWFDCSALILLHRIHRPKKIAVHLPESQSKWPTLVCLTGFLMHTALNVAWYAESEMISDSFIQETIQTQVPAVTFCFDPPFLPAELDASEKKTTCQSCADHETHMDCLEDPVSIQMRYRSEPIERSIQATFDQIQSDFQFQYIQYVELPQHEQKSASFFALFDLFQNGGTNNQTQLQIDSFAYRNRWCFRLQINVESMLNVRQLNSNGLRLLDVHPTSGSPTVYVHSTATLLHGFPAPLCDTARACLKAQYSIHHLKRTQGVPCTASNLTSAIGLLNRIRSCYLNKFVYHFHKLPNLIPLSRKVLQTDCAATRCHQLPLSNWSLMQEITKAGPLFNQCLNELQHFHRKLGDTCSDILFQQYFHVQQENSDDRYLMVSPYPVHTVVTLFSKITWSKLLVYVGGLIGFWLGLTVSDIKNLFRKSIIISI